jgi:hypothetical protein
VNIIQICKHESCTQCIKSYEFFLTQNQLMFVSKSKMLFGFQSISPQILSFDHPKLIIEINFNACF